MPGIIGMFSSRDIASSTVEHYKTNLMKVSKIRGAESDFKFSCGKCCLVASISTGFNIGHEFLGVEFFESGKTVLVEGFIFNLNEVWSKFFETPMPSMKDALLGLHESHGAKAVAELNGEFNLAFVDLENSSFWLYSDHLASSPLYFIEYDGVAYFASEKRYIWQLIDRLPELDHIGLIQVVAQRYSLDERTVFSGLKRLKPFQRIQYSDGRASSSIYGKLTFKESFKAVSTHDLASEWADLLKTSCHRRLENKDRLLMSLSAGLDSRAVACAIAHQATGIKSRTRGDEGSLESVYAEMIAEKLGFEHFKETPDSLSYSQMIPKILWRTESETHFMNAVSVTSHRKMKKLGDYIIGGWLGDITSGGHIAPDLMLPMSEQAFYNLAFNKHLVFSKELLGRVFSSKMMQQCFGELFENFRLSFNGLEGSNVQRYELWDLYQRQRRQTTSSMPIDSYCFGKIRPFYDRDYIDFTLTLPTRYRFGQSLYQKMIYLIGPEIRSVPSANNDMLIRSSMTGNLLVKFRTLVSRLVARQLRRVVPSYKNSVEKLGGENPAEMIRSDPEFFKLIDHFIDSDFFDANVFNRSGIKKLMEEHMAKNADHSFLLGYVATFAVGIPLAYSRPAECPDECQPLS